MATVSYPCTHAMPVLRRVMDMTNCARKGCPDPGVYHVDIDDTWFVIPSGPFRDSITENAEQTICVYHTKTAASLYSSLNPTECRGEIVHTPGYRRWRKDNVPRLFVRGWDGWMRSGLRTTLPLATGRPMTTE